MLKDPDEIKLCFRIIIIIIFISFLLLSLINRKRSTLCGAEGTKVISPQPFIHPIHFSTWVYNPQNKKTSHFIN